jgi:gliding motility-associated-like protein
MKVTFITAALSALFFTASAQNLVPNPSFEGYNNCPFNHTNIDYSPLYNQFPYVQAWVSATESTPDYFNACAAGSPVAVPDNLFGYVVPHSGSAYTGMYYWIDGGDYREYLMTKLNQPLQAGRPYYVSMYVTNDVPDFVAGTFSVVGIYDIGINLSATNTSTPGIAPIYLTPHVKHPTGSYLTDTANWVKVSGLYIATGGEEWMTIGNFYNGTNVPNTMIYSVPGTGMLCYMFMDDVNLSPITDTIVSVHDTVICNQNFPVTLAPPAHNADIVLWNTGDTSASISVNSGGKYWKHSWNESTLYIDSFIITAPTVGIKPLELGPDTAFCGNELKLTANHDYLSYSWNTGATTKSITVTGSGAYILTVTDSCGSQDSDAINITLYPTPPAPQANDTAVCAGASVMLSVTGQNILWYNAPGSGGSPEQPVINTSVAGTQTLYVSQTVNGCESNKEDIIVTIKEGPKSFGNKDTSICTEHSIRVGTEQPGVDFSWNTGENTCCITINKPGKYIVTMHNDCGTADDAFGLSTFNCTNCIIAPTAFTPNGDGLNDEYRVNARCLLGEYFIGIYNRFGEQVFESKDILEGWDGRYKGEPADVGTYFFQINYRANIPNAQGEIIKGDITLIR